MPSPARTTRSLICPSHPCREKQLLCMARAILKRSKVLLMDEVRVASFSAPRRTD